MAAEGAVSYVELRSMPLPEVLVAFEEVARIQSSRRVEAEKKTKKARR
jgi:hypothetical protein